MYCSIREGSVKYAVWPNEYLESLERPQIAQDVARPKWESKNPNKTKIFLTFNKHIILFLGHHHHHVLLIGQVIIDTGWLMDLSPPSLSIIRQLCPHKVYLILPGHRHHRGIAAIIIREGTDHELLSRKFCPTRFIWSKQVITAWSPLYPIQPTIRWPWNRLITLFPQILSIVKFFTFRMTIIPFIIVPDMS